MGIGFTLPRNLAGKRSDYALAYRLPRFAGLAQAEILLGYGRYLYVEVDAVEERSGDAIAIAADLIRRAMTFAGVMAEETAGTRIHRRQQLEASGKFRLPGSARNADFPGLQRFTQHFEHIAIEFRQFVEEQYAVHRHRDFARPRITATAHQGHRRRSVVRGTVRTTLPVAHIESRTAERLHSRGRQRFFFGHRRQDAGKALRDHGLAGSRRPGHLHAVDARDRH